MDADDCRGRLNRCLHSRLTDLFGTGRYSLDGANQAIGSDIPGLTSKARLAERILANAALRDWIRWTFGFGRFPERCRYWPIRLPGVSGFHVQVLDAYRHCCQPV